MKSRGHRHEGGVMLRASGFWRLLGVNAVLAAVYAVLGTVALLTVRDTGLAAPVWPAAGVALAAVLALGWRVAPGVAIGSLLVNIPAVLSGEGSLSTAFAVASVIALGAALEAGVGATLVARHVGSRPELVDGRSIVLFLVLAGPVACLINPTIGLAAQLASGVVPLSHAAMVWFTWWVGDSIGVIVFAPMTLMLLPPWRERWSGRRLMVVVPSLILVTATTWMFLQSAAAEAADQERRLGAMAIEAQAQLERTLERQLESLEGIRGLVNASDYVSGSEFRIFTEASLARDDGLQALAWDVAVPARGLSELISRMRLEEGVTDFAVTERASDGSLVPVRARPLHAVVTYIEPVADNAAARGFDIMSDPLRAAAAIAARDSGEARATAPVDLVVETATQKGVLVLLPVYDRPQIPGSVPARQASLRGFAVGVYRLSDLLDQAFSGPRWNGVDLTLVDVTNADAVLQMATRPGAGESAGVEPVSMPLEVGGRTWVLGVEPTTATGWVSQPTYAPGILLAGLVGAVLLEAFLLLLAATERAARREADVQGYEARHDALTGLYNRRAFLHQLQVTRQRAIDEGSVHVLLYVDLDDFKHVNDVGGHESGDLMLVGVSGLLQQQVRSRDVVARIGGDEFAIILNNCSLPRAVEIGNSIVDAIRDFAVEGAGHELFIGASVGVAPIDGSDSADVDEVIRRADSACYEAKAGGKGHVRAYEPPPVHVRT